MGWWIYPNGHASDANLNLDSLGQLYIILGLLWTLLLLAGIVVLVVNRNVPAVRVRHLRVSLAGVCMLHVYGFLALFGYVLNGKGPCSAEYWTMGIYFPFGIALYQMDTIFLRHVHSVQKQIAKDRSYPEKPAQRASGAWAMIEWWKSLDILGRAIWGIGAGMAVQAFLTLTIFLISRRFHSAWGIVGSSEDVTQCIVGWEWLPTTAWQFIWTWIYAPYTIWTTRGIEDVHGWRFQTVLCCLAGMPGTPLWIAALYSPAFKPVNVYWYPHNWFVPGILLMEACLVFIPCWKVLKSHQLHKHTLDVLEEWENKQMVERTKSRDSESTYAISATKSVGSASTLAATIDSSSSNRSEMHTMQALEKCLAVNSTPLLLFAALKDFSGENISFLNHVREWKERWDSTIGPRKQTAGLDREGFDRLRRRQFNHAVEIYISLVSMKSSKFPINIPSAIYKELEAMLEGPARTTFGESVTVENDAIPFASWNVTKGPNAWDVESQKNPEVTADDVDPILAPTLPESHRSLSLFTRENRLPEDIPIPDEFNSAIFDQAQESVKYMVLTNTWPKFIRAGSRSPSIATRETKGSKTSDRHSSLLDSMKTLISKL